MPMLDRRIDALEDIYVHPRERIVIRIVPMTLPGRVFVPSAYSLRGGRTIASGAAETQGSFEARVTAEALTSTSGVPMIFSVDGTEVSAA
jgi:hypothetical protein